MRIKFHAKREKNETTVSKLLPILARKFSAENDEEKRLPPCAFRGCAFAPLNRGVRAGQ